jgi:hypothetical protein
MSLTKYLAGKTGVQERVQYNKILGEIQRIGWEIQRINDHARTLAQSLTEAFESSKKVSIHIPQQVTTGHTPLKSPFSYRERIPSHASFFKNTLFPHRVGTLHPTQGDIGAVCHFYSVDMVESAAIYCALPCVAFILPISI